MPTKTPNPQHFSISLIFSVTMGCLCSGKYSGEVVFTSSNSKVCFSTALLEPGRRTIPIPEHHQQLTLFLPRPTSLRKGIGIKPGVQSPGSASTGLVGAGVLGTTCHTQVWPLRRICPTEIQDSQEPPVWMISFPTMLLPAYRWDNQSYHGEFKGLLIECTELATGGNIIVLSIRPYYILTTAVYSLTA